jgi:hypothetical protein
LATVEQHISKAENNESFTSFIGNNHNYIDWKFVALYYSALHFGDAFIAKKLGYGRYRIENHDERRMLYNDLFDDETFLSYERLEKFSRYARYHPEKINLLTEKNYNDLLTNDFIKMKSLSQQCK